MRSLKRIFFTKSSDVKGFSLKGEKPCIVDCVTEGSIAQLYDVKTGDILLSVNGINVTTMEHANVTCLICASSPLTLELLTISSLPNATEQIENSQNVLTNTLTTAVEALNISNVWAIFVNIGEAEIRTKDLNQRSIMQKIFHVKMKGDSLINKMHHSSDCICLFEASSDTLRIRPQSGQTISFPMNLVASGDVLQCDRRFGYVIAARNEQASTCYLYRCLPSKFISHPEHFSIAANFGVSCHQDRLTGDCLNFPRNTVQFVTELKKLLEQQKSTIGGLQLGPDNVLELPQHNYHLPALTSVPPVHPTGLRTSPRSNRLNTPSSSAHRYPETVFKVPKAIPLTSRHACTTPAIVGSKTLLRTPAQKRSGMGVFTRIGRAATSLKDRWLDKRQSLQSRTNIDNLLVNPSLLGTACTPYTKAGSFSVNKESDRCASWSIHFDKLLNDPTGLDAFRKYLSSEFSDENLDFWIEAQTWQVDFPMPNAVDRAKSIFDTFLDPRSSTCVNVDQRAVTLAAEELSHPSASMFVEAEQQVYKLMKTDSYPRFLKSSAYHDASMIAPRYALDDLENIDPNNSTERRRSLIWTKKLYRQHPCEQNVHNVN